MKRNEMKSRNDVHCLEDSSSEEVEYNLFILSGPPESYLLDVFLNDKPVKMQLDTGEAVSVINATTYKRIQQLNFVSHSNLPKAISGFTLAIAFQCWESIRS